MNEAVEVLLWGRRIGVASRLDGVPYASFAYDPDFSESGLEPSPLMMPVGMGTYSFPNLASASFHGLPGLLADSVPDKFGNAVLGAWLKAQGRLPESLTPIEQLFRRMAFNVLAWNCDDHVKNISYLMDRSGEWLLAPAYDECYAYNPEGGWTSRHQMSVNGKRIGITDDDVLACARFANMRERKARAVLGEVKEAVHSWPRFAAEAEVRGDFADAISRRILD